MKKTSGGRLFVFRWSKADNKNHIYWLIIRSDKQIYPFHLYLCDIHRIFLSFLFFKCRQHIATRLILTSRWQRISRRVSKWCYINGMLTKSHEFEVTLSSLEVLKDTIFFIFKSHLEVIYTRFSQADLCLNRGFTYPDPKFTRVWTVQLHR